MRFYVTTAESNADAARAAMELIWASGHEVIYDWTKSWPAALAPDYDRRAHYLLCAGRLNLSGVLGCDALVVLAHPDMRYSFAAMGAASVLHKEIYVVPHPDIMSVEPGMVRIMPSVAAIITDADEWAALEAECVRAS